MNFKNLYSILLVLCFPIFLAAQEGNCVIFSIDGADFYLALDNKFQNKDANTNVKVTNIPEGDYWVTVYFTDKTRKAFKSNIRVLGKKETSFQIEKDDDSWKLKQYSSVPTAQVQSISNKQTVLSYNEAGVNIQGMNDATEINKDMVVQHSNISRVHGTIEEEAESKRAGKFSGSSVDIDAKKDVAATTPTPTPQIEEKEGTSIINQYIETTDADGITSILEETTTLIKQVVVRDGQRQMRTKRNIMHTPTDLTCLPMGKEAFTSLKNTVQSATAEQRLSLAQDGIKDQCMTSNQIKAIGDLILGDVDRNNFAITAKEGCANPKKFPYTISDVVAVKEPKVEEEVVVVKEEPVVVTEPAKEKTKAELKAELKALKAKAKAEKTAAKVKAKAEKTAAKVKAKAEKAAAKAKAKAEKEAAKKK
jgi:hypothetical protein